MSELGDKARRLRGPRRSMYGTVDFKSMDSWRVDCEWAGVATDGTARLQLETWGQPVRK